jgi:hypothetical protein
MIEKSVNKEVFDLCQKFPIYIWFLNEMPFL